jgi:hypothetical protein
MPLGEASSTLAPHPIERWPGHQSDGRGQTSTEDRPVSNPSGPSSGPGQGPGDASDDSARSAQACPRCGAHRLALLSLPDIDTTGYRPLDEAYGMTGGPSLEQPAIGCLACGADWPNLAAFQAEADGADKDASPANSG